MNENPFNRHNPLGLNNIKSKTLEELGVTIDLAIEKDIEDCRKIRIEAIENDPSAFNASSPKKKKEILERVDNVAMWKDWIRQKSIILARNNSGPIGMIRILDQQDGLWGVYNVYLAPESRKNVTGAPIAEEMLKKSLDEIRNRGGVQARLWVRSSSTNAIKLYKNLGFKKFNPVLSPKKALRITGNRPDLFVGWYIMEKDLNAG